MDPYKVYTNAIFNRYMVAARFIKQGELILKENPLIVDSQFGGLICFRCCSFLSSIHFQTCENCNVALVCTKSCKGLFHCAEECETFLRLNLHPSIFIQHSNIITPLRLILSRNFNEKLWIEVLKLESHLEERKNTAIWKAHQSLVEEVLEKLKLLSEDDVKNEVVQKICGILDVNTFELRNPRNDHDIQTSESRSLRGLYLKAALMAHDCVANTHLAVDDEFVLYIYASKDIQEEDPIFFNYCNVLLGNFERKEVLMKGKYFECTCKRCLDPSELNTNISTLKCHKCLEGLLQPKKVEDNRYLWYCSTCEKVFKHALIATTLEHIKNRIEDTDNGDIMELEKLNTKLLHTLHPQHYLILQIQQNLIRLYTQKVSNKKNLMRKIQLCRNVLAVAQILEPGISRIQGMISYELHSAIANLAYEQYSLKEINMETLLQSLLLSEETLKIALKHLLYEPKKSPEGRLVQNAFGYLKILRKSICNIQNELSSHLLFNTV